MQGKLDAEHLRLQRKEDEELLRLQREEDERRRQQERRLTSALPKFLAADTLTSFMLHGFEANFWRDKERLRDVVRLREVSQVFRVAMDSDPVWQKYYDEVREGRTHSPPAIAAVLAAGQAPRLGAQPRHFEAFKLGLFEATRDKPTADDLQELTFHCRAKECGGSVALREELCPWWRGEPATRNTFAPDGVLRVTGNPNQHGAAGGVGRWYIVDNPHGCVGTYVHTVSVHGNHSLYLVRRLESWAWLLIAAVAFKCSTELAGRDEHDARAEEESAASLTAAEVLLMRDAEVALEVAATDVG